MEDQALRSPLVLELFSLKKWFCRIGIWSQALIFSCKNNLKEKQTTRSMLRKISRDCPSKILENVQSLAWDTVRESPHLFLLFQRYKSTRFEISYVDTATSIGHSPAIPQSLTNTLALTFSREYDARMNSSKIQLLTSVGRRCKKDITH